MVANPSWTKSFSLTTLLAVWGAILSSFVFGWNLYRDWLDRPRIKLSAEVRRIGQRVDGKYFSVEPGQDIAGISEALFIVISVVNVGRWRMRWKGAGGHYRHPVNGKSAFVLSARFLSITLEEQEGHDEFTELTKEFTNGNIRRFLIWDVAGRKWHLSRRNIKRLAVDAKKYTLAVVD
jgi:hypothetical protein